MRKFTNVINLTIHILPIHFIRFTHSVAATDCIALLIQWLPPIVLLRSFNGCHPAEVLHDLCHLDRGEAEWRDPAVNEKPVQAEPRCLGGARHDNAAPSSTLRMKGAVLMATKTDAPNQISMGNKKHVAHPTEN